MLPLLGILVVVIGFALRLNPMPVIAAAALVTGLAAGLDAVAVISAFGKAFNDNRYVSVVWLILPVIGLLERAGLQERARMIVGTATRVTTGRLLLAYFTVRQITAALGLTSLGGHPQMVRPLIAPMAEATAESTLGPLPEKTRQRVRANAAATDNIALFFGEDVFIAIGSILLIVGFMETSGIVVQPLALSLWAIPTAILAYAIHAVRLMRLDAHLKAAREKDGA